MTVEYDPGLVEQVAYSLDLRDPNARALDKIAQVLDDAPVGTEMVADLATGVGKTYIAGGLIDYLAGQGVRNVVIITPGSTIQRKTVANLTPGNPKYLRGLQSNPFVVTIDDFERGQVGAALDDRDRLKVFVLTVQSLLRPNTKDARRAYRPHETVGQALYEYLQSQPDLVVIADEHHIYYSGNAKKFQAAIDDLRPQALIGLTATPHEASEPKVIFRYPLAEAIADGYVKIPVLVGRDDAKADTRTQMGDAVALLEAKASVMREFCARTKKPFVQPVMFVAASSIAEANEIADMLAGPDLLGSGEQVLVITSEEPDVALARLDTLEDPASKVRAVVSVSMLKEGWDNRAIFVISATRALASQLLTEQILGRGLRLPFGSRVGVPMLDTVEVVSHHSFRDLLKQAKVFLEQALGERQAEAAETVVAGIPGTQAAGIPVSQVEGAVAAGQVMFELPGATPAEFDPNAPTLFDDVALEGASAAHTGFGFGSVGTRLVEAQKTAQTLATPLYPRSPGAVRIPLFLPRVTTKWVRDPFSLTKISEVDVEALGSAFAHDNAPTLTRKVLDAQRGSDGAIAVIIHDAQEAVVATQEALPFNSIEQDLVGRLVAQNGIEASVPEINAAVKIAQAFLRGAGVTSKTPWRPEHGRLATARLIEWISTKQTSSPAREVKEVTQVRWPDGERIEALPPADRQLVTSGKDFQRWYPYTGWDKAVYEVNSFDAYSTEFRLAELFERSKAVDAWVRVNQTVPLRIAYFQGAIQRDYEPDFLVIDTDGTYWIVEGKSNREMTDPTVLAKRDAARDWVGAVNASDVVPQRWGYLLASEAVIANAGSWDALRAGAQTFL
ncbi:DEAD/DEAH box helicase family protein [Georgenia yuyongxinii]